MPIKSFTVGVKHHVNLGNYESMEVEAQVTLEAEDLSMTICRVQAQEALTTLLSDSFEAQRKPSWFSQIATKKITVMGR